jgi:hypothetical protein
MTARWLRRLSAAFVSVIVCAALAGCAQSGGAGATPDNGRIQAERPPGDYVLVGSVAGTNVGTNFESGDMSLSLFFGLHFINAASEAKPAHPGTSGAGTSVRDPIRFNPPVGVKEEIETALDWLAGRFPDRSDLKAWLLRSPESAGARQYLLYVEFKSAGASNAVYLDVTRWSEDHRDIGS